METPQTYYELLTSATKRRHDWALACSNSEYTLHQLSPYIGKLKSSIAKDLIEQFSQPGDVVCDPFSGSGTIPLEAAALGRSVVAIDASLYAITLTKGKLLAPPTLIEALKRTKDVIAKAEQNPLPDLRKVPKWVREFFHPQTLKEALRFVEVLKNEGDPFLLSCFLGILHHQRPGFLSYPSSHLVPYLRDKLFPREEHPSLYCHRDVSTRILAKVNRAYKRTPHAGVSEQVVYCRHQRVQDLQLSSEIDCLITSPPYMNALDYGRDNRLRLWFLGEERSSNLDKHVNGREEFLNAMISVAKLIEKMLRGNGFAVFVIGEHDARGGNNYPSEEVASIIHSYAPTVRLENIITDKIPDVRRSRRKLAGVKEENILIYRKVCHA